MPVCAVLGAQWGDEGKGKIVDYLAKDADIIARFNGGPNAGHTVINDLSDFQLHLMPVGVLHPGKMAVIGNGCVVDPDKLLREMLYLQGKGVEVEGRLMISDRAHMLMPYHIELDRLSEKKRAKGGQAIGTTGSGIGPAYADKASRIGIRAGDLLDLESLHRSLTNALDHHNAVIASVYCGDTFSFDQVFEQCKGWAGLLASYIGPVEDYVSNALQIGKTVLVEGAQGAMLDVGLGTYPFVTSSPPTIGGVCTGLAIQPRRIDSIIGVLKAYSTRVGKGPLVTELFDEVGEQIGEIAHEVGVTTGRKRRVGWLDVPAARYSDQVNGYTSLALTRLDILDHFTTIKVCTAYMLDGERIDRFPSDANAVEKCLPCYEEFKGWDTPTAGVTRLEDLPEKARSYIKRIEELVEIPVSIVSTGPKRHETIMVRDVY